MKTEEFIDQIITHVRHQHEKRLDRLAKLGRLYRPIKSSSDVNVKEIRALTGLSQVQFANLLEIQVSTLRNWEQGRREPTGPARSLLRAIHNDPIAVIKALNH